jgi:hypothetical protein
LFSFNITMELMRLHFRLGLCISIISLYIIIGSLILRAEISRRLKVLSPGSVITLIGVVKGEKHAVGFERVRADVAVGNSSWPSLFPIGAKFCENEVFYEKFRVIVAITGYIKSHRIACASRLVQQLGDDGTSPHGGAKYYQLHVDSRNNRK